MIKRLMAIVLLMGMFFAVLPASAATFENLVFGEDYSKRIEASDFEFILTNQSRAAATALTAGGTVSAQCKVKRTAYGTGSQSCTLILMVYNGGKLIGLKTGTATAPEDKTEIPLAVAAPVTLPGDISAIRVYAYVWTDFLMPRILARPAVFGSSSNSLYELNINGVPVDTDTAFASGNTYEYELEKYPLELPKLTAKADDLGARIEITNVSSLPGTASVSITSQSGEAKTYNVEFSVKAVERTVENAITDDTNSRTNQYLTNYAPTGPLMQTNIYNGIPMNNNYNATLKRSMIQLDVTKFPDDMSLVKDIKLSVTGQCTYNAAHITAYCPSEFTVNAYDFTGYEWDETTVAASATTVGPGLNDIVAKTPFTSFTVAKSDSTSGPWEEKTISIKSLISAAKANGDSKVTVILLADNTSRNTEFLANLRAENSNNRDELSFVMATKDNTAEARRPKVIIEEYLKEE